jgi:hypothetical protein
VSLVEQRRVLEQRLQHGSDIGVSGRLISRQGAGITSQERQMLGNNL